METVTMQPSTGEQAKALRLIGLARRAGKLSLGTEACRGLARSGKAKLLLLATGASENTVKRLRDTAAYYRTDLLETILTKEDLGHALGKNECAVVGLSDKNLAVEIKKLLTLSGESI